MKKIFTTLAFFSLTALLNAQNVGIGTPTPNASAKLEITDANRGVLIPRIALTATNAATPVTTPATSLLVYNTATAGTTPNNVTPGYYYWDGVKWVRLLNGESSDWKLLGNTGIVSPANPATYGTSLIGAVENWIGTSGAQDFVVGTNNIERLRVKQTNGWIGIGTAAPTNILDVSSGTGDAIFGHSNNVGGYLGRETNITFGTPVQTLQGAGVYANNPAAGYTSIYAQSAGAATVAANISFSDVWMASYNYVQNASATYNPSANYNQLNVTSTTLAGNQIALRGYMNRTVTGNPGYSIGIQGIANSTNQDAFGVQGLAYGSTATRAGGYFEALNAASTSQAFAYVGTTVGGINRKITGTNAVSEIIPTPNHGRITMTAPESPEYWYQDYGTAEMINGRAHVDIDPILADIVIIDAQNPIRAFFTPQDMLNFNGAAIVNQTATGFDIVELNGGRNNGKVQYQIIVRPKTGYGEGRFPQAPGPAYLKADKEPAAAKAKNQPNDGRTIFYWPADHDVYKYNPEDHVPVGEIIPAGPNVGKVKLGNGKYGEGIPAQRPSTEK
jgi:hypothetical protein